MHWLTWQEFIAGCISGSGALLVSHPVDTLKVRHQEGKDGMYQVIVKTVQKEGALAFYKGVTFPVLMTGIQNAVYFGVYANVLRHYVENYKLKNPNQSVSMTIPIFKAGCYAALATTLLTTPIEKIKITLQTNRGFTRTGIKITENDTIRKCVRNTYRCKGIRGFYSGLIPTIIRDVPTGGAYIWIYVYGDNYLKKYMADFYAHAIAGGIAGSISYVPVTPFDVIKTRLQADNVSCPRYRGLLDCIHQSYKEGGLVCFWRGGLPTFLRAFINNSTVFVLYETCLKILKVKNFEPDQTEQETNASDPKRKKRE